MLQQHTHRACALDLHNFQRLVSFHVDSFAVADMCSMARRDIWQTCQQSMPVRAVASQQRT